MRAMNSGLFLKYRFHKPARLAAKPEEPFQPGSLHPFGRLAEFAGVEIEGRPDAHIKVTSS
jgi:hypothetical protein